MENGVPTLTFPQSTFWAPWGSEDGAEALQDS